MYDGNVYVVGRTYGALPTQTKTSLLEDAFIRKYDASGSELWTRQFGTPTSNVGPSNGTTAQGVAVDSTGVYVVGTAGSNFPGQTNAGYDDAFIRKYDASGNELWTRQFGSPGQDLAWDVAVDNSGVYVVGQVGDVGDVGAALPGQTSAGAEDAFIRKYDASGNVLWTRQFGSTLEDRALSRNGHERHLRCRRSSRCASQPDERRCRGCVYSQVRCER